MDGRHRDWLAGIGVGWQTYGLVGRNRSWLVGIGVCWQAKGLVAGIGVGCQA